MHYCKSILAFLPLLVASCAVAEATLSVTDLKCEHRQDPLGIDELQPELSWLLSSDERGVNQSAYRILVATTPQQLADDEADLWDSGKTLSDVTFGVAYEGEGLRAGQRCFWKVRVWDQDGNVSEWSKAAVWSIGLIESTDWKSEWIGYDADRGKAAQPAPMAPAKWVIHREDEPGAAPAGDRLYVYRFNLPADTPVESAEALVAGDNLFWLSVNGDIAVHEGDGWQRIKPVGIGDYLHGGENEIRLLVRNESKGPSGLLFKADLHLQDGRTVALATDGSWQSAAAGGQHWPTRPIDPAELGECRVVGDYGCEPWGKSSIEGLHLPPAPKLRGEFTVEKPVRRATLYVSALGNCDAYINGQRVSEERFTPGWTDYERRVYYRAYDVTDRIRPGTNALGGVLSDGWYSGYIGWGRRRDHYGTNPRMRMQLNIELEDGTTEVVGASSKWRAALGPTLEADFLMGESYDARQQQDGWAEAGFDTSDWHPVDVGAEGDPLVQAHPGPPVVTFAELTPQTISEPKPGVYVFDLGQYIAGVARLRVAGAPGQEIQLRFAERLNPDGTLYTTNLRGARCIDRYMCRGGGTEVWEPRFTFHGFQYVEVTGLTGPPDDETITGLALSSDTPVVGRFACSDETLNQLVNNIYWTQRANFIDVPTDCPQRDERLGWTGDAQVYISAACLLTDSQAFFTKWLVDLMDGQREDGQFPMVAPLKVAGDDGGPAWADAGVICPWAIYENYGDRRLLQRCYPSMKRFVNFCHDRCTTELLPPDEFHCFGDWLSINADTPKDVIFMSYFAHSAELVAHAAEVLGEQDDALHYANLAEEAKDSYNRAYVADDGVIKGDTQCVYAMAISYDLLDDETRHKAAAHLIADIEERDYHLSTGFVGTKDLMLALAKIGRNDVAYRLIHQDTFPSWGFSIRHGATSIWERWDGWTPEHGFQDAGMNSFAHYSFGAVYRWMVESIGGIRNGDNAYKRIVLAPSLGGEVDAADVTHESIRGEIASHWTQTPDRFSWDVTIPPNTAAELRFPNLPGATLTEGGQAINASSDIRITDATGDEIVAEVGSGTYSFLLEQPQQ